MRTSREAEAAMTPEAKAKVAGELTDDKANTILANGGIKPTEPITKYPSLTDEQKTAYNFIRNKMGIKEAETADDAMAKRDVSDKAINQTAYDIVHDNAIASIRNLGSYRDDNRIRLFNAIQDEARKEGKDPTEYDEAALTAKSNVYNQYTSQDTGKPGNQISSFGTFLLHANEAFDTNAAWRRANSPLINRPMNWLAVNATNDPTYIKFKTALEPVRKEFMTFLNANRAEHEADLKTMKTLLDDKYSPAEMEGALTQLVKTSDVRLKELASGFERVMHRSYLDTVHSPMLDAPATEALNKVRSTQAPAGTYLVRDPRQHNLVVGAVDKAGNKTWF
jgi:hypothetical protein